MDYFSFLNIFVLADDQPAPPPGQATVRVLVAGAMGVVNVAVNGSVPVAFQNLYYSTPNVPYPGGFSPPAGTASVSSNIFLGAGTVSIQVDDLISNQPIIPTTPITLAAGAKYTLVVTKPTSAPYINNSPVVPPVTTTYALKLVKN
ncbi:hypothetical protein CCAX7_52950 [Capsulimonas corticalis]|uniref:Uncharacterized protein n=1 Tax=Capsulimonas corticalis TaxID=2219043 RepID=A0A402CP23_9BACT|nr:hypothetical protein CCAX7_52950 [Capsulimonas corticalis]